MQWSQFSVRLVCIQITAVSFIVLEEYLYSQPRQCEMKLNFSRVFYAVSCFWRSLYPDRTGFFHSDACCPLDRTCGINYNAQLLSFPSGITASVHSNAAQSKHHAVFSPRVSRLCFHSFCPRRHLIRPQLAGSSCQMFPCSSFFALPQFLISFVFLFLPSKSFAYCEWQCKVNIIEVLVFS